MRDLTVLIQRSPDDAGDASVSKGEWGRSLESTCVEPLFDRLGPVVRVANDIWESDLRTDIWIVIGEKGGEWLPRGGCHYSA